MIKHYLTWPWLVSVPLLLCGFACSVFFVGTESILLAPYIWCLLCFVLIALLPGFRAGWAIPRSNTFFFVVLFWLWLVVALSWSTVPFVSTIFTIILSILPVYFIVTLLAPRPENWARIHGGVLWAVIGGFAIWAIIQFLFLYKEFGPRIHHPMLNPNNLAGLFNLGLFPAIGLFFLAKGRLTTTLTALAIAIFYMAMIVTQSRGAFLACAISAVIFLPFIIFKTGKPIPWVKIAIFAAIAVFIPVFVNTFHSGALETNLVGKTMTNFRSAEDRFYLWESTLQMLKDHPLLGTGLATFYFYYPRYRSPDDRSDGFFAHMDPLQFGAETGIMAMILFYAILICVLFRTIKAVRTAGPDLKARIDIIAPFCGMLALTGHTHITFHLYMPGMLLPLAGLLSYWYIATEKILGDAQSRFLWKPKKHARLATIILFAAFISVPAIWTARTSVVTHVISKVQKDVNAGRTEEANRGLSLAGLIAPGSYGRYYEYEARFRISKLWKDAATMKMTDAQELYLETQHFLDKAEELNPAFTTIWDLRARMYYSLRNLPFVEDGEEKAITLLTKVITLNPLAAESRVGLANIYKERGELDKAVAVMEQGIRWPRQKGQTDVKFFITLANLKLQQGDQSAYQKYMGEAQRRAKNYGMLRK